MSLENFLNNGLCKWIDGTGPDSDIVISSRVRLARNFSVLPFTHNLSKEDGNYIINKVSEGIIPVMGKEYELYSLNNLEPIITQSLVEKHLISPALAESSMGAVLIKMDQSVSIMINEEDHLRIQCLYPGMQLDNAYDLANKIDDLLEERIDFAFSEEYGYLTSCPTNVGTGMRASVMLHLPALVQTKKINKIFPALSQVGLVVRGLFGEGTEAQGNLFQVSNQVTLGLSEREILENLKSVVAQIIEHERGARRALIKETELTIKDKVFRAKGILSSAFIISSTEAMEQLSLLRLGIDMGIIEGIDPTVFNELIISIQSGLIQLLEGKQLSSVERDNIRSKIIKEKINS